MQDGSEAIEGDRKLCKKVKKLFAFKDDGMTKGNGAKMGLMILSYGFVQNVSHDYHPLAWFLFSLR
jgi:hypothetical protein